MKIPLWAASIATVGAIIVAGYAVNVLAASCTPFFTAQGGTGNCGLKPSFIPFGGTTATSPFATSTGLFWDNANSILNATHYLATASSTFQNFTALLSTTTSATTTNLFSTTASSTNLFTQLFSGAGLSTCIGINALTWTGGTFSCTPQAQGTVTAVTATWPVTSSGGTTPNITWSGLASSTNIANTQVLFATGVNTYASNSAFTFNTTGNIMTVTNASTTALTAGSYFNLISGGRFGVASTSPWGVAGYGTGTASTSLTVAEYRYGGSNEATSTAKTLDCRTANQQHYSIGTSATTLTLSGIVPGQRCMVIVENPNGGTPGAVTFAAGTGYLLLWVGGTAPTPTATNNKQDVYSFLGTQGSSTIDILGAASLNF